MTLTRKQMILPQHSIRRLIVVYRCVSQGAYVVAVASFHHVGIFIISHHHKKEGEYSIVRYFDQRPSSHGFYYSNFYNCSVFLLVIVVNLLCA